MHLRRAITGVNVIGGCSRLVLGLTFASTPIRFPNRRRTALVGMVLEVIAGDHQLKGSPLFLVTDAVSLAKSENILVHQWRTINGTTTLLS